MDTFDQRSAPAIWDKAPMSADEDLSGAFGANHPINVQSFGS